MRLMPQTRATRQKEAILRAAKSSGDHPTAEAIHAAVRREIPNVSLGTVYRNLQRLVAEGRLLLAPVGDRSARFDPMTEPHDHFVCEVCHRIYDRPAGAVDLRGLESEGFEVRSHALAIYGVCPACVAKQGKERRR